VLDVDLSQPMDDALFRDIERAWHEHCVLLFRSQTLDDLQQVAFAARFGELAHTLKDYEGGKIHPALMYVTNEKKDGKYVGALPDGEMFFHSDMCYLERPLSAAMLFAIALPPEGGNTILASMYAAYGALPADLREKLDGRLAMNSYEPGYGTSNVRMRIRAPASPTAHGFAHPVIRTHGNQAQGALRQPADDRVHRRHAARGERRAARARVRPPGAAAVPVRASLGGRRHGDLGQPLHAARAQGFSGHAPAQAPPGRGEGRAAGLVSRPPRPDWRPSS
jgi:alpha-ketoglutarate-dependent taurine dioxygenase